MKRFSLVVAFFLAAGAAQAQLLISGVIDGPLSGGVPKAIELYATEDIPDLSIYGVGSANNGGGSDGEEFTLSGSAVAGQFIYVASEAPQFEAFFGFAPDFTDSAASINGDDAIELFMNDTVIDVFGDIFVDGSGQPWEYLDGWAYRIGDSNGGGSSAFVLADWLFSGPNALDGFGTNDSAGMPFPACSYAAGAFDVTGCSGSDGGGDDDSEGEPGETDLIITGVVDGPLSGGTPKAIELLALADIADLSVYGLGSANNGGGTDGQEITLSGSAVAGEFIFVASEADQFQAFFSFPPDFTSFAAAINGDDAIELFRDGQVVDVFGEIAVDGTGEPWEYQDGWAYRMEGTGPDTVFMLQDWEFSGVNALDNESSNDAAAVPFPACSYPLTGVETSGCEVITPPPTELLCDADPGDVHAIFDIQGARHVSPLVADGLSDADFFAALPGSTSVEDVVTHGVVTAVDSNGFYLQDPAGDGDTATSDGIFVFTGSAPSVAVGDEVSVAGPVAEFFPGGTGTRNLPITQLLAADYQICSTGNALPAAVIIGASGRVPPNTDIDPDAFTIFSPASDGLDFFESLEGMLVTVEDALAAAPTTRFGEIFALANQGAGSAGSGLSARGTLNISPGDFNPERIQIDEDQGILDFAFPSVAAGALLGDVTGVVSYSFGNFEVLPTVDFSGSVLPSALLPEMTDFSGGESSLTVASYNVLNLDPNETDGDTDIANGRFDAIAAQIVTNLHSPDIIGLQEIQDNSGSANDGVVSASDTLQTLVDAIVAAGGPNYDFVDNTFIADGLSGGQPVGNIRTAFLYNAARVAKLGTAPVGSQDEGQPFFAARLPLAATFEFNDVPVTIVNNHFSSKGGSAPIMGIAQDFAARQEDPTVNGSLDERQAQSAEIQAFVAGILAEDPEARVVVLGDLNEFEFVSPVSDLETVGLTNLTHQLPPDERYSFIFQGNSQSLDHILASDSLLPGALFEVVHVNVEFPDTSARASDHDPALATFIIEESVPSEIGDILELVAESLADDSLVGAANNPRTQSQREAGFLRLLDRIAFWEGRNRPRDACRWADIALRRVDGEKNPGDFVEGPAATAVAESLRAYLAESCAR